MSDDAVNDAAHRSRIADIGLPDEGERRIEWAARPRARLEPPRARAARGRSSRGQARSGRRAPRSQTAYVAILRAEAGEHVVAAGSNPGSTQDAVCAALVRREIEVHATHGADVERFTADPLDVADTGPQVVSDDGAELTRRILDHRPELAENLEGVSEETTTGVGRLRAMGEAGRQAARRRQGVLRRRQRLGRQRARACCDRARRRLTVVELDPVRALTAHTDGHRVASLADALPDADVVITTTGLVEAIPREASRT